MKKLFQKWCKLKEWLHDKKKRPYFSDGEIWFCELGANVGFEQDGVGSKFLRPVLILKKFNNEVCLIVPLTRTEKKSKFYFDFELNGKISVAILSQIRLIDVKRLDYKIGAVPQKLTKEIKKHVIRLIE